MLDRGFWRGRTVFLTGHTGFKGAWACVLLSRLGARVIGYSLEPTTKPSLYALLGGGYAEDFVADVRDPVRLADALRESGADVVLHMAAQSLVRRSYLDPAETFAVNVMGTVNLLEAVRSAPQVKAVVIVTSDKVYDLSGHVTPRREADPLGGSDPYSASKGAAEIVAASYIKSFFGGERDVRIATARSGNVIGGGDWAHDRIVTDLIAAILHDRDIELRYPDSVRPWLHVLDTLTGYLTLVEHLWASERYVGSWNFGPLAGEQMTVRSLAEAFFQAWGTRARWRPATTAQPPEAPILTLDASRAWEELGWRPFLGQLAAISDTANWFRRFTIDQLSARTLCEAAVDEHIARASQRKNG